MLLLDAQTLIGQTVNKRYADLDAELVREALEAARRADFLSSDRLQTSGCSGG